MDWVDTNNPQENFYTVARCVSTRNFKQLPSVNDLSALARASGDAAGSSMDDMTTYAGSSNAESSSSNQATSSTDVDLGGARLSMRLTGSEDRSLPAVVEVDAGQAATSGETGSVENYACRDPCFEVNTSDFPRNTNWINAHARLVSSMVVAGVMWVALFH